MSNSILRQNVIDAITAERLNDDTGSESDAAYERALDDVVAAVNAIPGQPTHSAVFSPIENLLLYHETGGHEGDISDSTMRQARRSLEALRQNTQSDDPMKTEHLEGYLCGLSDLKALTAEEDAFRAVEAAKSNAVNISSDPVSLKEASQILTDFLKHIDRGDLFIEDLPKDTLDGLRKHFTYPSFAATGHLSAEDMVVQNDITKNTLIAKALLVHGQEDYDKAWEKASPKERISHIKMADLVIKVVDLTIKTKNPEYISSQMPKNVAKTLLGYENNLSPNKAWDNAAEDVKNWHLEMADTALKAYPEAFNLKDIEIEKEKTSRVCDQKIEEAVIIANQDRWKAVAPSFLNETGLNTNINLVPGFGNGLVHAERNVNVNTGPDEFPNIFISGKENSNIVLSPNSNANITTEDSKVNVLLNTANLMINVGIQSDVNIDAKGNSEILVEGARGNLQLSLYNDSSLKYTSSHDQIIGSIIARDNASIEIKGTGRVMIDKSENVKVTHADPSLAKNIIFAPKEEHKNIAHHDGVYESAKNIENQQKKLKLQSNNHLLQQMFKNERV